MYTSGPGLGSMKDQEHAMPFDIMSDLMLTALCAAAMLGWIGRELAQRARQPERRRRSG
jgi:hypothetical protein